MIVCGVDRGRLPVDLCSRGLGGKLHVMPGAEFVRLGFGPDLTECARRALSNTGVLVVCLRGPQCRWCAWIAGSRREVFAFGRSSALGRILYRLANSQEPR